MKLLSLLLLGAVGLTASELGPVAATPAHVHAAYSPAPLIFAATPRMGSCPFRELIGGYEQRCYGYGIYMGSGQSGTWYKCSSKPYHKWIE
jgi:hypothetical protein